MKWIHLGLTLIDENVELRLFHNRVPNSGLCQSCWAGGWWPAYNLKTMIGWNNLFMKSTLTRNFADWDVVITRWCGLLHSTAILKARFLHELIKWTGRQILYVMPHAPSFIRSSRVSYFSSFVSTTTCLHRRSIPGKIPSLKRYTFFICPLLKLYAKLDFEYGY